jgi:hypothetical protein
MTPQHKIGQGRALRPFFEAALTQWSVAVRYVAKEGLLLEVY